MSDNYRLLELLSEVPSSSNQRLPNVGMSGRFKSCGLVALYFTRECRKFTSTWPKWEKFRHFSFLATTRGSGMSSLFCTLLNPSVKFSGWTVLAIYFSVLDNELCFLRIQMEHKF